MSVDSERPVLIIGAGIAGLSLACTLHTHQVPFKIFDAQPATHAQGYSITLRSWAFEPLLQKLDVRRELFVHETATDSLVGGCGRIEPSIRDLHTGENVVPIGTADDAFRANRTLLRKFLMRDTPTSQIYYEKSLIRVEMHDKMVDAYFHDGEVVTGAYLVAADGIHSQIRKLFLPSVHPALLPATVYNGQVQISRSSFNSEIRPSLGETNVLAAVTEYGMVGISITSLTSLFADLSWFYTRQTSERKDVTMTSTVADHCPATREEMIYETKALAPVSDPYAVVLSTELLDRAKMYHWPMQSVRIPLDHLYEQVDQHRVVLIGDAAHAMPIFAGEGGNHGLQDGFELGTKLGQTLQNGSSWPAAISQFYQEAYDRWQTAIKKSESRMQMLQRPLAAWKQQR